MLQSSKLKPLNELENSRLKMVVSRYKIEAQNQESVLDVLLEDISAINDFLFYIESEPFITPEKAKNIKRVPFKKAIATPLSPIYHANYHYTAGYKPLCLNYRCLFRLGPHLIYFPKPICRLHRK